MLSEAAGESPGAIACYGESRFRCISRASGRTGGTQLRGLQGFNKGVLHKEVVGVDHPPPGSVQFAVGSDTFKCMDQVVCRLCLMPGDP